MPGRVTRSKAWGCTDAGARCPRTCGHIEVGHRPEVPVEDSSERAAVANRSRQLSSYAGSDELESWSGKLFVCPNEMVPLQIDLAIEDRRYLLRCSTNPPGAIRRVFQNARPKALPRRSGLPGVVSESPPD